MSRADLSDGSNFGVKFPAQPYGDNNRPFPSLFAAIVVNGAITKYLPLKVTDNEDGTATLALGADVDIGDVNLLNAIGTKINPATEEKQDSILAALAGGLPVCGEDATGQDAYAIVVTAPSRECSFVHVAVENNGAIISLDGGTNDHFYIPPNTSRLFQGLVIAPGVTIRGRNLTPGSNYTNLRISVW